MKTLSGYIFDLKHFEQFVVMMVVQGRFSLYFETTKLHSQTFQEFFRIQIHKEIVELSLALLYKIWTC